MLPLALPAIMFGLPMIMWNFILYATPHDLPKGLTNTDVTLLIAHPDDELMFFSPTYLQLVRPHNNNTVRIVSVTSGNAEGEGELRKRELIEAAKVMNLTEPEELITVVDDPEIQDSMEAQWDPRKLEEILEENVKSKVLITFDDQGVSDHANHKALYGAAARWKSVDPALRKVWTLDSVPIYRKYIFFVDALYGYIRDTYLEGSNPRRATITSRQLEYQWARKAMINGHKSQLKWYRWFYLQFSRYMVVNDLTQM
ncbi:hypothetical protein TRICI_006128 [Trichomonascus ciferrii]|uniref:N-acetylglucosaminylphosphatidylinositol deacetylase n=1 Tax=Trichomonascus ciferrii TaxID=44093 RepID=A0A642UKI2_9ASCO|nr:hypothetical protein TRICI_006128 [Trichomonascus ciferrii]